MRKILATAAAILLLQWAGTSFAEAEFQVLAPAEESFMGLDHILIIGKVEGFNEAKMVELTDNGKTMGFAPLQKGTFIFGARLGEGRHEIVLTAPGVGRKAIKIFVGKQEGYRYHIETDTGACNTCHPAAPGHDYAVRAMQGELCSDCHDPKGGGKFVHGPVAASSCTPCHDPHGSRYEKFLVAVGKELCLVCHSQNLSKKHIEERKNADCVKCHDPHSSDKNYHLR